MTMGCCKDLTDDEKRIIIKELANATTPEVIANRINRHVVTVNKFLNDPVKKRKIHADCGSRKSVSKRDLNSLKRKLRKLPGATSARIFKEAGVPDIAKSTRNRILANAETKCPKKNHLLTTRHKTLHIDWAKTYMKTDMKYVLFTDESRATLDGPDGWSRGWVIHGDQCPTRIRRQQEGGGVMLWAGILGDELVGPLHVQEGVIKLTSHTYCQFFKSFLEPWLEEIPLSRLRNLVYMHNNAPSHAAKATTQYLESTGLRTKK